MKLRPVAIEPLLLSTTFTPLFPRAHSFEALGSSIIERSNVIVVDDFVVVNFIVGEFIGGAGRKKLLPVAVVESWSFLFLFPLAVHRDDGGISLFCGGGTSCHGGDGHGRQWCWRQRYGGGVKFQFALLAFVLLLLLLSGAFRFRYLCSSATYWRTFSCSRFLSRSLSAFWRRMQLVAVTACSVGRIRRSGIIFWHDPAIMSSTAEQLSGQNGTECRYRG